MFLAAKVVCMASETFGDAVPTKYWHTLDDGRVQCDVCPRFCKLHEGQRGFCFVRASRGRPSRAHDVRPFERVLHRSDREEAAQPLLPGTPVLSFGTAGLQPGCKFCQNWDISKSREMDTLADEATPDTIARAAQRLGCQSVAFTYNDPVIFMEYAIDVARACHERGIKTVAVTAGDICARAAREFYSTWMRPTST